MRGVANAAALAPATHGLRPADLATLHERGVGRSAPALAARRRRPMAASSRWWHARIVDQDLGTGERKLACEGVVGGTSPFARR
jgi:hypothetical protein